MSLPKKIKIVCPKCGNSLSATVFESVNTDYANDLPKQIMTGELFHAQCPHCKFVTHLEYDFLYHDIRNAAMVWVVCKKSPDYISKVSEIRAINKMPYNIMRIVEDLNALKEKVSCLEKTRDDRIVELCKVFVVYNLFSQHRDFAFRNAFYTAVSGKEVIYLYDIDGNSMCYDLSDDLYNYLQDLYNNSPYAERFEHNYPVVDYAWGEEILKLLIENESERIEGSTDSISCKIERDAVLKSMIVCPSCNRELPNDSEFCQYCGTRIIVDEEIPAISSATMSGPDSVEACEGMPDTFGYGTTATNEKDAIGEMGEHATSITKVVCPACNNDLPDDSEFCQFCGRRILVSEEISVPDPKDLAVHVPTGSAEILDNNSIFDDTKEVGKLNDSDKAISARKKKNSRIRKGLSIVLIVAVFLSIAGNIGQYFFYSHSISDIEVRLEKANKIIEEKEIALTSYIEEISSKTATIASNKTKIASQETTINQQKKQISDLKVKKDYFDEIVSKMRYGNAGYAASNFCASDSVIIVDKNDTSCKFTLTANWANGGTVSVDYSSGAARVSFDNNSWSKSTSMTVHPYREGVTVVTFSNNVDSKTFKVLIIVTD